MSDKENITRSRTHFRNSSLTLDGENKRITPSPSPPIGVIQAIRNDVKKKQGEMTRQWHKRMPTEELKKVKQELIDVNNKNKLLETETHSLISLQEKLQIQLKEQENELSEKERVNKNLSFIVDERVKEANLLKERILGYEKIEFELNAKNIRIAELEKANTEIKNELRISELANEKLQDIVDELTLHKDQSQVQLEEMNSIIQSMRFELVKVKNAQANHDSDMKVTGLNSRLQIIHQEPLNVDVDRTRMLWEQFGHSVAPEQQGAEFGRDANQQVLIQGTVTGDENLTYYAKSLEKQVAKLRQELAECKNVYAEALGELQTMRNLSSEECNTSHYYDLGRSLSEGNPKWKSHQASSNPMQANHSDDYSATKLKRRMKQMAFETDLETSTLSSWLKSRTQEDDESKKIVEKDGDQDDQRTGEEEEADHTQRNWVCRSGYGTKTNKRCKKEEKPEHNEVRSMQAGLQISTSRVMQLSKQLACNHVEIQPRELDEVQSSNQVSEIDKLQNELRNLKAKFKGEALLTKEIEALKNKVSDIEKEKAKLSQQLQMQIFLYSSISEKSKEQNVKQNMEPEEQSTKYQKCSKHIKTLVKAKSFCWDFMPSSFNHQGVNGVSSKSFEESKDNLVSGYENPQLEIGPALSRSSLQNGKGNKIVSMEIYQDLVAKYIACNMCYWPESAGNGISSRESEEARLKLEFQVQEQKVMIENLENKVERLQNLITVSKTKLAEMVKVKRRRSLSQNSEIGEISKLISAEGDKTQKMEYLDRVITERELALHQLRSQSDLRIQNIKEELMMKDNTLRQERDRLSGKVDMLMLKTSNYERQLREFGDKERYIFTLEQEVSQLTGELVDSREAFLLLRSSKAATICRLAMEIERLRLNSSNFRTLKKGSFPAARRPSTRGKKKLIDTAVEDISTLPYSGHV